MKVLLSVRVTGVFRCLTGVIALYLRLKIVDDDIDWKQTVREQAEVEEDEEEAPVVS